MLEQLPEILSVMVVKTAVYCCSQWIRADMIPLWTFLLQSFVDLQFPNGQLTYVAGEGLTTSAFLPLCGGLLQAQGQYPGEMRFSFSYKVGRGNFNIIRAISLVKLFLLFFFFKCEPFR